MTLMTVWHRGTSNRRRGFTIIELLMVIAIISIVTAWALPKFSIARYRADAAGRLVRTLLQTGQRNAITRQSNVVASFDLAQNRVRLIQDLNNNNTLDAGEMVQYRPLAEGAKFTTPSWAGVNGTTPTTPVTGAGLVTISSLPSAIFRRDGSASTDLEIYVTTRDAVKVEYRAVMVTASTGRTEMYKWNGTTWLRMTQ
jgi:prepilin-type N-terminal cleavage/methylation domain-containing protein